MSDSVVVQTGPSPCLSVIWLHGLGADGHDFEPIVDYLKIPSSHSMRFIFPHAPKRPVTVNFGMIMRAWYDLYDPVISGDARLDKEGLADSAEIVNKLAGEELEHVGDYRRIVFGGFSQGGAVALHTGLRFRQSLGGIFALSSYLPGHHAFAEQASQSNGGTPILLRHGTMDPVITVQNAYATYSTLYDLGNPVDWKSYLVAHSVSPEICLDIGKFLTNCCHSEMQ